MKYSEGDRQDMEARHRKEAAARRGSVPRYFEDCAICEQLLEQLKGQQPHRRPARPGRPVQRHQPDGLYAAGARASPAGREPPLRSGRYPGLGALGAHPGDE